LVKISATREVNSSVDQVWQIVSDVDNDQEYWKGLGSIKNIRKERDLVERTVKVGFMENEGHQTIMLNPKDSIQLIMTKGPLKGTRWLKLEAVDGGKKTKVNVSWDFEFSRVPVFARGFVKSQLEGATEEALSRIALASGKHSSIAPQRSSDKL
jgi:ribosome-associated toxin RatA of RatAB toxin-antitoxin module